VAVTAVTIGVKLTMSAALVLTCSSRTIWSAVTANWAFVALHPSVLGEHD
jgi:hypothetical protein